MLNRTLLDYFRCPEQFADIETRVDFSERAGFFLFGQGITCYGRCSVCTPAADISENLQNAAEASRFTRQGRFELPFDLSEVVSNLRLERYFDNSRLFADRTRGPGLTRSIYYALRPILPIAVRKHLQRAHFRGWQDIPFPRWPVDFTVERLLENIITLILQNRGMEEMPFIWFWPNGSRSCVLMTHDVETKAGLGFCDKLMEMDISFGMKSAFQIIPEMKYPIREGLLERFRSKGFEVNVHDLSHDGSLFRGREKFLHRAERINQYAEQFRSEGFRSGGMYRNQAWYDAFQFSYDMSVPNVAHLEPQRGGCCTVMPYFIGRILELPLTTAEDYSIFHILGDYSIQLWKSQIELISNRNGLLSFITHPDYLIPQKARRVYSELLAHLAAIRDGKKLWIALPSEVNWWWRNRQQMQLVREGHAWRIEGPDSKRARIAYASLNGSGISYRLESES